MIKQRIVLSFVTVLVAVLTSQFVSAGNGSFFKPHKSHRSDKNERVCKILDKKIDQLEEERDKIQRHIDVLEDKRADMCEAPPPPPDECLIMVQNNDVILEYSTPDTGVFYALMGELGTTACETFFVNADASAAAVLNAYSVDVPDNPCTGDFVINATQAACQP